MQKIITNTCIEKKILGAQGKTCAKNFAKRGSGRKITKIEREERVSQRDRELTCFLIPKTKRRYSNFWFS